LPLSLVSPVLGLVLIVAGVIKLYQLTIEAEDQNLTSILVALLSEAELLAGIWLVAGFHAQRTRPWAAAFFGGLAVASLFQALGGKCSCGCFGSLTVSPWFTFFFDIGAVAALLVAHPRLKREDGFLTQPMRLLWLGACVLMIGVIGSRQGDLVTLAGTATSNSRPIESSTLTFTGDSGRIDVRTDHNGKFRLRLVQPGLYAVSAAGIVVTQETPSMQPARTQTKRGHEQSRDSQSASVSRRQAGEHVVWMTIAGCSEYEITIGF
jgi:hypothetical protein